MKVQMNFCDLAHVKSSKSHAKRFFAREVSHMGFRFDYILNQIEKACQLIATLLASKKVEPKQQAEINQRLAELTGFQLHFFEDEKNAAALLNVLNIVDNDNT